MKVILQYHDNSSMFLYLKNHDYQTSKKGHCHWCRHLAIKTDGKKWSADKCKLTNILWEEEHYTELKPCSNWEFYVEYKKL